MKTVLSVTLVLLSLSLVIPFSHSQDVIETPAVTNDVSTGTTTEYYDPEVELTRLKELTLSEYADEIADNVIEMLNRQKEWYDLVQEFLERTENSDEEVSKLPEIEIPEKSEIVEFVYKTANDLGGPNDADAAVGYIAESIATVLFDVLTNLPFSNAQCEMLNIPSIEKLSKEALEIDAIYYLNTSAMQNYNAVTGGVPVPLLRSVDDDGLLADGTAKERVQSSQSERRK
jgi:hypothetical protein